MMSEILPHIFNSVRTADVIELDAVSAVSAFRKSASRRTEKGTQGNRRMREKYTKLTIMEKYVSFWNCITMKAKSIPEG